MRGDRQEDVEVAAGAAPGSGVALAGQADAGAVVHPRGNPDLQLALAAHLAVAVAGPARVGDHPPLAAAPRAGPLDGEEALGGADPALAVAGGADGGGGAGLGARALADLAGDRRRDDDLDLRAGVGLLEADLEIVAKVLAARRAAPAAAAEHLAEHVSEHLGEDVARVLEAGPAAAAHPVHSGVAEAIVGGPLLRVAQHRIGFVELLEPGLGLGVARVAIGVVLHGELAEGGLQLDLRAGPGNPEEFVIVARHLSVDLDCDRRLSRPREAAAWRDGVVVSGQNKGPMLTSGKHEAHVAHWP